MKSKHQGEKQPYRIGTSPLHFSLFVYAAKCSLISHFSCLKTTPTGSWRCLLLCEAQIFQAIMQVVHYNRWSICNMRTHHLDRYRWMVMELVFQSTAQPVGVQYHRCPYLILTPYMSKIFVSTHRQDPFLIYAMFKVTKK